MASSRFSGSGVEDCTASDLADLIPSDNASKNEWLETARVIFERHRIVDDMTSFLSERRWDLYAHLTFENPIPPTHADKKFRAWIHGLNRAAFGHNYYKRNQGSWWVRSTELQDRGVLHYHAVVGGCPLDPTFCSSKWKGNAQVEKFDPNRAGLAYLVKSALRGDLQLMYSDNLKEALPSSHR